jgi:hypothetical protein
MQPSSILKKMGGGEGVYDTIASKNLLRKRKSCVWLQQAREKSEAKRDWGGGGAAHPYAAYAKKKCAVG